MEKTSLESAIKNEAEQAIKVIAEKETAEIRRLDEAYAAEIQAFRKRMEERTDARIRQETAKAEHRASLDLKKYKLRSVEAFINRTVEEAVTGIRDNPRYKKFILDSVGDTLCLISQGIEVRLGSEDLVYEKQLRETIKAAGGTADMTIVEDKTIKWGGRIIVDRDGGRIFDNTIERIYFRKSPVIRREVMSLLSNPPRE